jgi:protein-S-isoprenylcysteine O-methyltransferase Ste14
MVLGLNFRYATSNSFLLPYLGPTSLRLALAFAFLAPPLLLVKRIIQEEAMLDEKFGNEWREYREKTWIMMPFIW